MIHQSRLGNKKMMMSTNDERHLHSGDTDSFETFELSS
jgi:hypothetical protein